MTRTTVFTILCVGLRVSGLILIVSPTLTLVGHALVAEIPGDYWPLGLVFWAATVAFGLYLWLWPGPIARLASDRMCHEALDSSIDAAELQYVGFSLLGCWFALAGLLGLAADLRIFWVFTAEQRRVMDNWPLETLASSLENGLCLLIGVILLLGGRGLARILQDLRYRNTPGARADDR